MHPLISEVQKDQLKKVPELKAGYTVRVHQKIKEGDKERVQVFEGLIIKMGHGEGVEKTVTVRKIVQGIGVEKVFPIHSKNISKIEVKKKAKIRRSKLYYMRERSGKSARLKERHITDQERAEEEAKMEAMIGEAVKAEEKRKKAEEAENPTEVSNDTPVETKDATPEPKVENSPAEETAKEEPKKDTPKDEAKAEGQSEDEQQEANAPVEKPAEEVPDEEETPAEKPKDEEESDDNEEVKDEPKEKKE